MKLKTIYFYMLMALTSLIGVGCVQNDSPMTVQGTDVYASDWITPTSWSGSTGDWFFDVSNSAISGDIVEAGVILAYMSVPGDLYNDYTVRPLPAYAIGANWDFLLPNDGNTVYGKIEFTSDMVDLPGTSGYNFRFILIPSTYSLKSKQSDKPSAAELKQMTYSQVCKLYGIKE